jgi:hypothetical protein
LRGAEADEVVTLFRDSWNIPLVHRDAADLFLAKLAGVSDPEGVNAGGFGSFLGESASQRSDQVAVAIEPEHLERPRTVVRGRSSPRLDKGAVERGS